MMLRVLAALSLALLPLTPLAAAETNCVAISSTDQACGSTTVDCGLGTGTGSARTVVTWTLVVAGDFESTTSTWTGTAAALAGSTVCRIPGCTTATLYANGILVDTHQHCVA